MVVQNARPAPPELIGLPKPWDGTPIRKEIFRGFDTHNLQEARKLRDLTLGEIRKLQYSLGEDARWSLTSALEFHETAKAANRKATHTHNIDAHYHILTDELRAAEQQGFHGRPDAL